MGLFSTIVDKFGGGIIKEGFDIVKAYFPPSMTEQQKTEAQLAFEQYAHAKELDIARLANETEREFNRRLKDLEGTAADLKTIPIIGHMVIFLRGAQRPAWGIFVLVADYMTFSGAWNLSADGQLRSMLFAVNILVLGFLFGERAVKNVTPFIAEFLSAKKNG